LILETPYNGETDRRLNDGLEHSFDSSVRVGVGRRLRRTGPLTVYSFAIGRAQSDRPTPSSAAQNVMIVYGMLFIHKRAAHSGSAGATC